MRQLAAEGFMHNRARMITASFLTRNLGISWRHGYRHFGALLADGDVANNAGNWQWVAGTGHNTRPNRVMNPLRQAQRFDRPASTSAATCRSWLAWPRTAAHSVAAGRRRPRPAGYPDPSSSCLTAAQARSWH